MLVPSAPASLRQRHMTPLPKVQLAVCMVARLVEPIGYSVLLAFIYKVRPLPLDALEPMLTYTCCADAGEPPT